MMGVANEQIRVSERVKREIERRRREGESYNDVLERLLAEADAGDFYDGFGRWSDEEAERVREARREAKEKRTGRMRERTVGHRMNVLDPTFLFDYLDGRESTREFYEDHGGDETRWVTPVPALAEVLVAEENLPGDVDGTRADLAWIDVHPVDERAALKARLIADEIAPGGPYLDAQDALAAAVGRELDAPVVSADGDLTHDATRRVVDVEPY